MGENHFNKSVMLQLKNGKLIATEREFTESEESYKAGQGFRALSPPF
jgi:hypothetical protein